MGLDGVEFLVLGGDQFVERCEAVGDFLLFWNAWKFNLGSKNILVVKPLNCPDTWRPINQLVKIKQKIIYN